ncbi:MAG: hypothetical protein HY855_02810 [Burkholderiales bacterium]|nr:hypothetical protein [Burkholderiales bacterium]
MNTTDPLAILFGAADVIAKATVYTARVGRRRAFQSLADAHAYERGFAAFPGGPIPTIGTPAFTGYADAECAHQEREDARADERRNRE